MGNEMFLFICLITLSSAVVIFGHIIHSELTESRELDKSCENDLDCLKFHFAVCNENKKCECIDKFTALNGSSCVQLIGGYCWNNDNCLITNTVCVKHACQCKPTYAAQFNRCVPTTLGKSCETNNECSSIYHTECSEDKTCICAKHNIIVDNTTCQPLLEEFCRDNEACAASNSICVNNKCQCKKNYVSVSNHECVKTFLDQACDSDKDCTAVKLARCSPNKTCTCKTRKISHGERICLHVLGEYCLEDDECASEYALCIDNKCQCALNYVQISDYKCTQRIIKV